MKLFRPTIHWSNVNGIRSFAVTVEGTPYRLELISKEGEAATLHTYPVEWGPDQPDRDEDSFPAELTFLAAVLSTFKLVSSAFMYAKGDEDMQFALGAIHTLANSTFRMIEYTPRAAENQLSIFFLSELQGVPPRIGMLLFAGEILESLESPESEFEKELREKFTVPGKVPTLSDAEKAVKEMPDPTYRYVVPEVPASAIEHFEKRSAEIALARAQVAGSA